MNSSISQTCELRHSLGPGWGLAHYDNIYVKKQESALGKVDLTAHLLGVRCSTAILCKIYCKTLIDLMHFL